MSFDNIFFYLDQDMGRIVTDSLNGWLLHIVEKHYSGILVILETFEQTEEETWPDQQKDDDKDKESVWLNIH